MKEIFKNFSINSYLKTVLFSVMIVIFIGTILLMLEGISMAALSEVLRDSKDNPKIVRKIGTDTEESYKELDKEIEEEKEKYGEDYPIRGYYMHMITISAQCSEITELAKFSIPLGLILGSMVYIISVQKAKGKSLVIELVGFFAILCVLLKLVDVGYQAIVNGFASDILNSSENVIETGIYNIQETFVLFLVIFIIVFLIVYILNYIIQAIMVSRLNKELDKKNKS